MTSNKLTTFGTGFNDTNMTPKNAELLAEYLRLHDAIFAKNAQLMEEYNARIPVSVQHIYAQRDPPPDLIAEARRKLGNYSNQMIAAGGYHEDWNRMLISQLQVVMNEVTLKENHATHVKELHTLLDTNKDDFILRMRAATGYGPGGRLEHDTYQTVWREHHEKVNREKIAKENETRAVNTREHMIEAEALRRIQHLKLEEEIAAKMRQMQG